MFSPEYTYPMLLTDFAFLELGIIITSQQYYELDMLMTLSKCIILVLNVP